MDKRLAQTYMDIQQATIRSLGIDPRAHEESRNVMSQRLGRLSMVNSRRFSGKKVQQKEVVLNSLNRQNDSAPTQRNNILNFLVQKSFTDYQKVQQNLFQILDEMQEELQKKLGMLHERLNKLSDDNFVMLQQIADCESKQINQRVQRIYDKVVFINNALRAFESSESGI